MATTAFTMRQSLTLEKDDFKDAYVGGQLVIDCVEIKFTQNDSTNPRIYVTRGCIHASAERGVEARLIRQRDQGEPYDQMAEFVKWGNLTPGVMLPDSHYYQLSARDVAGNVWTHPSVDLKVEEHPDALVLSFSSDRIQTESTSASARTCICWVFLDELAFPENCFRTTTVESGGKLERSATRIESSKGSLGGISVSYDKRKHVPGERYSNFVAIVPEDIPVQKEFQDRMLEALRFCTATMASPIMSETVFEGIRTIELAKSTPLNSSGMVHAPISTSRPDSAQDFYRLFECYFVYACANAQGKEFAPISSKLGGIFTLKGVWLNTIALLLGVAVEGVLKESKFKNIVQREKNLLGEIKKLVELINDSSIEASLVLRVTGAIQGMSSSSASDKLHALVLAGALADEDRTAWKRIRNKSAHGSFEIDIGKLQPVLDDVFRLTTLIYKLVFLLIDYSGQYSNKASRGWRDDQFDAPAYWSALKAEPTD